MATPKLIYCAGANRRFDQIAIDHGFLYGVQTPTKVAYFPPYFCDQDWRNPNRERYMAALAEYKPHLCSVLDWEKWEQLPEVLEWAEEAAQFVEVVMVIPKVIGGVTALPRSIGGKPIRLGYSVPTRFSGTSVPVWEFYGWPVHLLGGSPHKQITLAHYLNVVSTDCNMHLKMATIRGAFWSLKRLPGVEKHPWPTLLGADGKKWGDGSSKADAIYEAFRRSCQNIMTAWSELR